MYVYHAAGHMGPALPHSAFAPPRKEHRPTQIKEHFPTQAGGAAATRLPLLFDSVLFYHRLR